MKTIGLSFIFIVYVFILFSCDSDEYGEDVLTDQAGTLIWGGSPATDGAGMIFRVEDTDYGAPGTPEDYENHFPADTNRVAIIADIRLTGETTIRGWGSAFPAIEFLKIQVVE